MLGYNPHKYYDNLNILSERKYTFCLISTAISKYFKSDSIHHLERLSYKGTCMLP